MSYNPFSINNQYDQKNQKQNSISQNSINKYSNRDTSPQTNLQNISNIVQNGKVSSNYNVSQTSIQNQGNQYQQNNYLSSGDAYIKQTNLHGNNSSSQQIQKQDSTQNNNNSDQQLLNSQIMTKGTQVNISQNQNGSSQSKLANQSTGITATYNYQNMNGSQNQLVNNINTSVQNYEKNQSVNMSGNNGSSQNLNQNSYLSSIQPLQAYKKASSNASDNSAKQGVKGNNSPLNRIGYQSKFSNMNLSNYSQNKTGMNGMANSQINVDDKNKNHQSQLQNNNLATNQSQNMNTTDQPISHSATSINNNLQNNQNGQIIPQNLQASHLNSNKELINISGSKSARNAKEQTKYFNNITSNSSLHSKTAQMSQTQRGFKSNTGLEDNSIRQQIAPINNSQQTQMSTISPLLLKNVENPVSFEDISPIYKVPFNLSQKKNTPSQLQNNNPQPANIPQNIQANTELRKIQHAGHTARSIEIPLQNMQNEYSGNKDSGQKNKFQFENKNQNQQNKSASNSRNISPQSVSANTSTSNLSISQIPKTQNNKNSNTVSSLVQNQQLFSKKLQEQRNTKQNQNLKNGLNLSQTEQKLLQKQRQNSSQNQQQKQNNLLNPPPEANQSISNQGSSNNLMAKSGGSGQKVTFNVQVQKIPQDAQSMASDASSNTSQTISSVSIQQGRQHLQTLPSESNLNTTQNLETEFYLSAQTTQDLSNQNQNWQQWWSEKRNANLQFIQYAKLNKHSDCIGYLDKKRGDMKADVNYKDEEQNSALHYAAQNGNAGLLNILLYNEANIDSQNKYLMTPLMVGCIGQIKIGYEDVCQILITAGADINNSDNKENTALHYASMNGHKKIVDILLRKPSLFYKKKNLSNQEPYQIVRNDDVRKVFDNFFALQKQLLQEQQKIQIHDTKSQNIQQMIQKIPKNNNEIENKSNGVFNLQIKSNEHDNKSSMDEKSSTSDESKSSFADKEEKVGPNDFIVHGLIGKGSFGEVYLVEKKGSQMLYAMKVLHKSKIIRHNLTKYAMTERNVMSLTNHPFIVKLNYAFQTSDKLFLIMDYCPGGDLGEHLQKEKKFSEELVKIYLAETVLALEDLHKRDVIFRDLKPDNIVLDYEGHVKLTDFGLSKEGVLDHSSGARSFCGSVAYLAPEMLKRCGHGKAVDWYLLGVVMYELVVGIPPYYANNRDELFYNIEKAPLKIPSYLSNDARSLLKALLQRNPTKRLGSGKGDAEEIKAHPFFNNIDWNSVYQRQLKPPRPNRKIRISTKIDPYLFAETDYSGDKDYVAGWSFVAL